MYDRFLPILAKYLPEGLIIDVGANIGGIALSIRESCDNPIICIEPDRKMLKYLYQNVWGKGMMVFEYFAGTGAGKIEIDFDDMILVKSDTDGSDWDVILSTNLKDKPIIFFENEITVSNKKDFERAYDYLGEYIISIFDNYGNLMLKNVGFSELKDINNYILRGSKIYYTDVVAYTLKDYNRVNKALDNHIL